MLLFQTIAIEIFAQPSITLGFEVDLGLSSGNVWAGWNLGADETVPLGYYYSWGETKEKEICTPQNYTFDVKTYNICGTKYDVAKLLLGGSWCIPSKEDFEELISQCKWTWIKYQNHNGYKIIGPNGNSIFLPAVNLANRSGYLNEGFGRYGYYWTSTYSYNNLFSEGPCHFAFEEKMYYCNCLSDSGWLGFQIRPVKHKEATTQKKATSKKAKSKRKATTKRKK